MRQEGFDPPEAVRKATASYRDEMDPLGEWIAECCVLNADAWASASELRWSYEDWARAHGLRGGIRGKRWGAALRRHGVLPLRRGGKEGWLGIGLVTDDVPF